MKNNITFKVNEAKIKARLNNGNKKGQAWLDNEVLKDSTPYVPRISGELERSGIDGTVIGSGEVIYNKTYAKEQYYGDFKHSTQSHPRASREWFEVAKAMYKDKWIKGVKQLGGGE